jgi:hypothetical protein
MPVSYGHRSKHASVLPLDTHPAPGWCRKPEKNANHVYAGAGKNTPSYLLFCGRHELLEEQAIKLTQRRPLTTYSSKAPQGRAIDRVCGVDHNSLPVFLTLP